MDYVWLNLIKDINDKQSKAENIISNAKNKANRLLKDTEKKVKNFKDSQTKKIKVELNNMEEELESKKSEILEKEKVLEKSQLTDVTRKEAQVEMREKSCEDMISKYRERELELDSILEDAKTKVENIAGLSRDEARDELVKTVENEAKIISARKIKEIEKNINDDAESKAKNIIALAIQKYAASYTSEKTASVVNLPSDDMKGRIIGKEGEYKNN